jgi:hypothetical protein
MHRRLPFVWEVIVIDDVRMVARKGQHLGTRTQLQFVESSNR